MSLPASAPALAAAAAPSPLPPALVGPLAACAWGGLLHLAAADAERGGALHLALDASGRAALPPRPLPLAFAEAAAVCAGALLVTGGRTDEEEPAVLVLGPRGDLLSWADVPAAGSPSRWPRPACIGGRSCLLWETTDGESTLWIAELGGGAPGPARPLPLGVATADASFAVGGERAALLCTHGPGTLSLFREEGAALRRTDLAPRGASSPVLAGAGGGSASLWVEEGRELRLQRLDAALRPEGAAATLARAEGPARLGAVRAFAGPGGRLAVSWRAVTEPDGGADAGGGTRPSVAHFLAAVGADGRRGPPLPVEPPGTSFHAGGWVGAALVLVHGGGEAVASVYTAREDR